MERTVHIPVLRQEVIEALRASEGGAFLDCTLGGGGHSMEILKANPKNTVVALDRDARAVIRANRRLEEFEGRIRIMHGTFSQLRDVLLGEKFDGILADLGISTDQLKENRGFSFNDNVDLDMRMDESQELSAFQIVNKTSERELLRILKRGGVGNEANAVVRAIIKARPINKTAELSSVINAAIGSRGKKKINPSTVVFQAIRIAVNGEYDEIDALMQVAPNLIRPGGRLAVISFHSQEDKLVAGKMREWEAQGKYPALWRGPRIDESLGKHISRKAIVPSNNEVETNSSSRSARMRVFQFSGGDKDLGNGMVSRLIASYSRRGKKDAPAKHHK